MTTPATVRLRRDNNYRIELEKPGYKIGTTQVVSAYDWLWAPSLMRSVRGGRRAAHLRHVRALAARPLPRGRILRVPGRRLPLVRRGAAHLQPRRAAWATHSS